MAKRKLKLKDRRNLFRYYRERWLKGIFGEKIVFDYVFIAKDIYENAKDKVASPEKFVKSILLYLLQADDIVQLAFLLKIISYWQFKSKKLDILMWKYNPKKISKRDREFVNRLWLAVTSKPKMNYKLKQNG